MEYDGIGRNLLELAGIGWIMLKEALCNWIFKLTLRIWP